jgi:hypothetical protein
MTEKPGPFQVLAKDSNLLAEGEGPDRNFGCENYNSCLSLAAALNWESFSCSGCTGTIDETIRWRAKVESKRDATLRQLCVIPNPSVVRSFINPRAESEEPSNSATTPINLRSILSGSGKEAKNG